MDPLIEELRLPYLFLLSFSIVVSFEIKEFAPLEPNSILYEYSTLKCLSCCGKLHDKVLSLSVDPIQKQKVIKVISLCSKTYMRTG